MIALPDVDSLMAGGLAQWLDGQVQLRAETRARVFKIMACAFGAALIIAFFFFVAGLPPALGIFLATVSFGLLSAYANSVRQKVVNNLKTEMNGALAKALSIDYSVGVSTGLEFQTAETYLLPSYDDSYFQDQWHGSIEGTDFLLYEVRLTETRGSGKDRRTVEVFKGVLLRFRFARPFLGTTLVKREGFKFTLFGDSKTFDGQALERIKMVDPKFEDAFDIYGSDPVEARYLVHPAYCERLLDLERQFEGEQLRAVFKQGDLVLALETGNMFESASLKPEEDRERLGKTIGQFGSMVSLVQLLNERPRG